MKIDEIKYFILFSSRIKVRVDVELIFLLLGCCVDIIIVVQFYVILYLILKLE